MLIRSQGKGRLINLSNVKDIEISEYESRKDAKGKVYYVVDGGYGAINPDIFMIQADGFNLGEYPTMEKAIKVLDMICSFADSKHYEQVKPDECGYIGGAVFQMPQDGEVGE